MRRKWLPILFLVNGLAYAPALAGTVASLVSDETLAPPARHGLASVRAALRLRGVGFEEAASLKEAKGRTVLVAGTSAGRGAVAGLLREAGLEPPVEPESLTV